MSRLCDPQGQLSLSLDGHVDPAARVVIDAEHLAPTSVHRTLFHPDQSDLPAQLLEALATVPPTAGGHAAVTAVLEEGGVTALDGAYARTAARVVHRAGREGLRNGVFRLWHLSRQPWTLSVGSVEDVVDGPAALLGQLDHSPTVEIQLDDDLVDIADATQRRRLLRYLVGLTQGIGVRIVGSRLALRRLVDQDGAHLPGDVHEWAQSHLMQTPTLSEPVEHAVDAIDAIGTTDRTVGHWRVLQLVCGHDDGRVRQARLQDSTLLEDVDGSTVRRRIGRLEDNVLVETTTDAGEKWVRPTAAGQAALSRLCEDYLSLVGGVADGDTSVDRNGDMQGGTGSVSDPPNSTPDPCDPRTRGNSPGGGRPEQESEATARSGSSSQPKEAYLDYYRHHALHAAAPSGGLALEERPVDAGGDDRAVQFNTNKNREEVTVEVTASPTIAVTAVRLCGALLSEKALQEVLTPAELNDGPDTYSLEALPISNPYVLRSARTLGWLRNADAEGRAFMDRLTQARDALFADLADAAEAAGDGPFESDDASELLRRAHGLMGVAVALYDLLGYDVVRHIRIPNPSQFDPEAVVTFVYQSLSVSSRYGAYTAHRQLYEHRKDKRAQSMGPPNIDVQAPEGTVSGSIVVTAPRTSRFRTALEAGPDPEQFTLQEDADDWEPWLLEIDIVDAHRREAVAELVSRLGAAKGLQPRRELTTALHALTGSPGAVGEALARLRQPDNPRELDCGDLAYGLSQLSHREVLPDQLPTVRKVYQALLAHDGHSLLSTSELAEKAGISTQSLRNNRAELERLEALNLFRSDRGDAGEATRWEETLPLLVAEDVDVVDTPGNASLFSHTNLTEVVYEWLLHLIDDRGQDHPIDLAGEAAAAAWHGAPSARELGPLWGRLYRRWPSVGLLARLIETSSPTSTGVSTVALGEHPAASTKQQSFDAAVGD